MDGEVILELTSADIPGTLDLMTKSGVTILDLAAPNGLSIRFRIHRQDLERVREITTKRGDALRQILRMGVYWRLRSLARHWMIVSGMVVLLFLTAWLPTKVLFVRVEGNELVPDRLILEKAAQCGIAFGAERGAVRSERMKNALLDALPQLQWAGINTYGCAAVITVKERAAQTEQERTEPGNIVSIRDGIIEEMTAEQGTAVKKVGQAVRTGEVLISGYSDCGGVILLSAAQGEVYGRTIRLISARTAETVLTKGPEMQTETNISLIIGKKRINFYKDSGILDTGCVKMYSEYYLTLPGGLTLPVKLMIEKEIHYQWTDDRLEAGDAARLLREQADVYLQTQMTAGEILSVKSANDGSIYIGEYVCRELISRFVHEEIIEDYGENCRTNG